MALEKNEARITVGGVPDVPGVVMKLFSEIAAARFRRYDRPERRD